MVVGYIYKIEINGLKFFGACRNLAKEFNKHIKRSRDKIIKNKYKLYQDYNNYNFKCVETYDDIDDKQLKQHLQEYIRHYNSDYEGLNETPKESPEQRRQRRNHAQNIYNSKNREKCRERCRKLRQYHLDNETFKCEICDRVFVSNSQLKIHLESKKHQKILPNIEVYNNECL